MLITFSAIADSNRLYVK